MVEVSQGEGIWLFIQRLLHWATYTNIYKGKFAKIYDVALSLTGSKTWLTGMWRLD